jgi:hypothetical protein
MGLGRYPRFGSDGFSSSLWHPSLSESSVSPGEHGWGKCRELVPMTFPCLRHCWSLRYHLVDMVGENAESWLRRPLLVFMTSVTVRVFNLTLWTWLEKMPRVGSDDLSLSPWSPTLSESSVSPGEHGWGKCQELAPTTSPRLRELRHCRSLICVPASPSLSESSISPGEHGWGKCR